MQTEPLGTGFGTNSEGVGGIRGSYKVYGVEKPKVEVKGHGLFEGLGSSGGAKTPIVEGPAGGAKPIECSPLATDFQGGEW